MASSRETVLVLCLGCGEDITHRKDDRRALQGTAEAWTVVNAWRELLELSEIEDEEERLLADALTAEDVSQEKMCRKCFSANYIINRLWAVYEATDNIERKSSQSSSKPSHKTSSGAWYSKLEKEAKT